MQTDYKKRNNYVTIRRKFIVIYDYHFPSTHIIPTSSYQKNQKEWYKRLFGRFLCLGFRYIWHWWFAVIRCQNVSIFMKEQELLKRGIFQALMHDLEQLSAEQIYVYELKKPWTLCHWRLSADNEVKRRCI